MKRARLDKFISARLGINRREVRALLAQGRVRVDGELATEIHQVVDQFSHVYFNDQLLQAHQPSYIMLHKPTGVVSATKDTKHRTVIDLLDGTIDFSHAVEESNQQAYDKHSLHIVGRLDFNTTGLMLLTNDSRWSSRLTEPEKKVSKRYRVGLEKSVSAMQQTEYKLGFAKGIYFSFEGLTTRPAEIDFLDERTAEVCIVEGRYHQIKRMFGHFNNKVVTLHRFSIGRLQLDEALAPGESRVLTVEEVRGITGA